MRAELAAAAVVVAAAVAGVRYWERSEPAMPEPQASALTAAPAPSGPGYSATRRDEVKVVAAPDHQFYVTAAVNNSPASFLIDTGASYVALRESDARLAGVIMIIADFNRPIRTANGETKAALVTIDVIEIDRIRVEDVKAFILPDDQLSVNLLGMSFLSRLHSVEAKSGELVLRG